MPQRVCALIALLITLTMLTTGCGQREPARPAPGSDATSPVEFVDKHFSGRPVGKGAAMAKYKMGSAKDGSSGKVQFEDSAGGKYEVTVTPEGKSFKAGEPMPKR